MVAASYMCIGRRKGMARYKLPCDNDRIRLLSTQSLCFSNPRYKLYLEIKPTLVSWRGAYRALIGRPFDWYNDIWENEKNISVIGNQELLVGFWCVWKLSRGIVS